MKNLIKKIVEYFEAVNAECSAEICRYEIESGMYLWY